MKKVLLLLALSLPVFASAQFKLTPSGFLSTADSTKTYIVVDAPGVSQSDLYKRSLIYLSGLYVSPKEVLSTIDNESITINAVASKAIKMKVLYLNPAWDVNYTVTFQFKDGKMRVSQPSINGMKTYTGNILRTASINPGDGANHKEIYNKKGELKQKDGKEHLEEFVNSFVESTIKGITAAKQDNW